MQMSPFQLILLTAFGFFLIIGVAAFSLFGGKGGSSASVGSVLIWGTVDGATMETFLTTLRSADKNLQGVQYVQRRASTYAQDLVNAIASGTGPDVFFVTQSDISSFADKIITIPYANVPQGNYLNSFIDEAQLFLTPQGSLAIPFMIDPLVMYWNKSLFASAGVAQPPKYWQEFLTLAPKITSIDSGSNLSRSAVAIGEWRNVVYAKRILSTLYMQAGDKIVVRNAAGGLESVLGTVGGPTGGAQSALQFYTQFADPAKSTYSWNRSLPNSRTAFTSGEAAVYFGPASDYSALLKANPNINIGVAMLPQIEGSSDRLTYGELTGMAIARSAKNAGGALVAMQVLSGAAAQASLVSQTGMPSVRRDLPINTSANASAQVFVQSSLIARGWLDPARSTTDLLFQSMIESVLSGREDPANAVSSAAQELQRLVNPQ